MAGKEICLAKQKGVFGDLVCCVRKHNTYCNLYGERNGP
jgi:hypothetical protein